MLNKNANEITYLAQILGKQLQPTEATLKALAEQIQRLGDRVDNLQGVETYEGTYTITPSPQRQTLETANLLLENDITVTEIPFFETSNTSGGNTVFIGSEVGLNKET